MLGALTRAYGDDVDVVLAWARTAAPRLLELDGDDDRTAGLRGEREQLRADLAATAAGAVAPPRRRPRRTSRRPSRPSSPSCRCPTRGSSSRCASARTTTGLPVDLGERPGAAGGGAGRRRRGRVPARPARRRAAPADRAGAPRAASSPGVMLGLEVVLGAADPVPTFVFDEVDAGVGGQAALGIGRRLARLARTSQVLVVTHLPQVAAFADRHLLVVKSSDGEVTESGVTTLDDEGRVRELARMLGGMEDSGSAQAHAEELLTAAAGERADVPGRHPGSRRTRGGSSRRSSVRPSIR